MKLTDLPSIMIKCLVCTIIIEVLVSLILGVRNKKDILNIVLVNIVTNPLVVSIPIFVMVKFGYNYRMMTLYILEILTVIVEGLIYWLVLNYKKINPFILSLLLNIASYFIGKFL